MVNEQRLRRLVELQACKRVGEQAYDRMYEERDKQALAWQISLAKDAFRDAYAIATELELTDEANAIIERLMHVKAVARQLGN